MSKLCDTCIHQSVCKHKDKMLRERQEIVEAFSEFIESLKERVDIPIETEVQCKCVVMNCKEWTGSTISQ